MFQRYRCQWEREFTRPAPRVWPQALIEVLSNSAKVCGLLFDSKNGVEYARVSMGPWRGTDNFPVVLRRAQRTKPHMRDKLIEQFKTLGFEETTAQMKEFRKRRNFCGGENSREFVLTPDEATDTSEKAPEDYFMIWARKLWPGVAKRSLRLMHADTKVCLPEEQETCKALYDPALRTLRRHFEESVIHKRNLLWHYIGCLILEFRYGMQATTTPISELSPEESDQRFLKSFYNPISQEAQCYSDSGRRRPKGTHSKRAPSSMHVTEPTQKRIPPQNLDHTNASDRRDLLNSGSAPEFASDHGGSEEPLDLSLKSRINSALKPLSLPGSSRGV